jgi:hypothetical protein
MDTLSDVAQAMRAVLTVKADELAKSCGLVKRSRKVTGSKLARTLVFGWLQNGPPSAEGLARAGFGHGLKISAQGLDKRLSQARTAAFMRGVLEQAVAQAVAARGAPPGSLLDRFEAVWLLDSTQLALPPALAAQWPGTGGSGPAASLKVDVALELKSGRLGLELRAGRQADPASPLASVPAPGALHLRDLGYFSLARLREMGQRGEYAVSRLQPGAAAFLGDGTRIDWRRWLGGLARQGVAKLDVKVLLGVAGRLPARLLLWRLPEEAAARRRAKLRDNARKKSRQPTAEALALCGWSLLVTNAGPEKLGLDEAAVLYRARWQIERLFKLWKTHAQLGRSRSANPNHILCEIYAKLVGVLLQHWLALAGLWRDAGRSLVKGGSLCGSNPPVWRPSSTTRPHCSGGWRSWSSASSVAVRSTPERKSPIPANNWKTGWAMA